MEIEEYLDKLVEKLERKGMVVRNNSDLIITDKGREYIQKFLERYPEMAILIWLSIP